MCYNGGIPNGRPEKAFDYQQCFKLSERPFCNACVIRLLYEDGMRKDRLKHCRSIIQMHRSAHRFQSKSWTQIADNQNRNILHNVGKGWFSRVECRVRNWPFWSYRIFLIGWRWIDGGGATLRRSRIISSWLNSVARFPDCHTQVSTVPVRSVGRATP